MTEWKWPCEHRLKSDQSETSTHLHRSYYADHSEFLEPSDKGDDSPTCAIFVHVESFAGCLNENIQGGRITAFYLLPKRNACPVQAVVEKGFKVKEHTRSAI